MIEYDICDDEPLYCCVCNMAAESGLYCSACDDVICAICGIEDERIIFCHKCWEAREIELMHDDEFEEIEA